MNRNSSAAPSLRGKCLVATPQLHHTMWEETVVYLAEHDQTSGAMGFVLNRPSRTPVDALFEQMQIEHAPIHGDSVYLGGPVKENSIYMLHSGDWYSASTKPVDTQLSWSYDNFMLEKMAMNDEPDEWSMFAGCCSWTPGQLESELDRGSWLTIDANPAIVFSSKKSQLWTLCIEIYGQTMIDSHFA